MSDLGIPFPDLWVGHGIKIAPHQRTYQDDIFWNNTSMLRFPHQKSLIMNHSQPFKNSSTDTVGIIKLQPGNSRSFAHVPLLPRPTRICVASKQYYFRLWFWSDWPFKSHPRYSSIWSGSQKFRQTMLKHSKSSCILYKIGGDETDPT